MKKLSIILNLWAASFLVLTPSFAKNRIDEHRKASQTFFNWHFFENGRGMTISPNMSKFLWFIQRENPEKDLESLLNHRYGFNFQDEKILGVFNVKWKKMDVGVLGCTACHSGKAAGRIIAGLGNKTIDPYQVSRDLKRVQRIWGRGERGPDYQYIHTKAMNFANVTSDPQLANTVKGLVSDGTIKTFFYKDHGLNYPKTMGPAQVKVPHLWGVKEKREAGIFNDGALSGETYAWIFGAELFASDSGEHLRAVLPKVKWLTDDVLGNLLPPKYPFKIDNNVVLKGKRLFENKCMKCHGQHQRDEEGFPLFEAPRVIPQHVVKTDSEKIETVDDEFIKLVETGSLKDLLSFNKENIRKGYFAPKLWGIWSRFPYLHNGSVPTLYHVMLPTSQRPQIFSMREAGEEHRFDKTKVGLTLIKKENYKKFLKKAKKGDREIYYTQRKGLSNEGHYFADRFDQLTHTDRLSIIEYLKTL